MNTKIKILVGILFKKISTPLGILLILLSALLVGVLVWQCWLMSVGTSVGENIYKCDIDSDCIIVQDGCCDCGNGGKNAVINKNYLDYWNQKISKECKNKGVCVAVVSNHWTCFAEPKCINNRCQLLEKTEVEKKEVTITTDKTKYEQGETVKTTITNNLDYSVTPSAANLVKADRSLGENYGIGLIEKFEDDKWVAIEPVWRCENSCFVECRYMSSFEPSETRVFEWEQTVRICNIIDRTEKVENAGPGKYRVSSNIWFIKEKNYKIIYSNEFTIE